MLAMTHAIRAGRVLALLIAIGSVLIFAGLSRLIFRDWRVALVAALAFALSGGVAVHSRILRSELVAACPIIFALMILIAIGRHAHAARPSGMAVAAALCIVGLENKVQAILLIGALPLLILPFGSAESPSAAFWKTPAGWLAAAIAALAASIAVWVASPLVTAGFDRALLDAAHFHPLLLNRFGVYQAALLTLIVMCMTAYAAIWRISLVETLTSILAVVTGAAIALLAARRRLQQQQRDRRRQSPGEDADLCRCRHRERGERLESFGASSCCCSTGSPPCSRATPSRSTPRRGRPCS